MTKNFTKMAHEFKNLLNDAVKSLASEGYVDSLKNTYLEICLCLCILYFDLA